MDIQFGKTAKDYAVHRKGFPDLFFENLFQSQIVKVGDKILDIGTGTGTIARGLAKRGCSVIGVDPAIELLQEAKILAETENCKPTFVEGTAENTAMESDQFDLVIAGQCWHWFDGVGASLESKRVLKPNGLVIIAHFDWLPLSGNVVSATEELIEQFNPKWSMGGGTGIYPKWPRHIGEAGFVDIQTNSYDINVIYTPEAWRGRIRASAGVAASLSGDQVEKFDQQLTAMLASEFPDEELIIPHRIFVVTGRKSQ
ncbi:MAG: methyltransferase domain-containing protein [Deltaproteobacteria bacterium]|nr:methyltransferase domain-containing protein [Deltaproteobacteria bacterium]